MLVREKSFYDYLLLLYRRRFLLLTITGIVSAAAVVVSLFLPKWYTAETVILPPKEEFSLFPSANLSRLSLSNIALGTGSEITDRYLAILNSRSMLDTVVNAFDLIERYGVVNIEDARNTLRGNLEFEIDEEGPLRIIAWDKSPERASEIANYLAGMLDNFNKSLDTQEARFKRITIENRYDQNIKELTQVEEEYKSFQEKSGVISLPDQTEVTIQATAEFMGKLSLLELDLGIKEKSLGRTHPEIKKIKSTIAEYRKQINSLMNASVELVDGSAKAEEKIFIPYNRFPELTIQYVRLRRNLESQQAIFKILTEQLELARLMETRDTPSLQILDRAIPPLKKAWPKRSIIVILTALSSFVLSVMVIFARDYFQEVNSNLKTMASNQ